jgi:hypothetical protein
MLIAGNYKGNFARGGQTAAALSGLVQAFVQAIFLENMLYTLKRKWATSPSRMT